MCFVQSQAEYTTINSLCQPLAGEFFEFSEFIKSGDTMNGKDMVKIIDSILAERDMTQKEFCEAIGVQSSAMSGWRKGSTPTPQRIAAIESFLGISFSDFEKSEDPDDLREMLRDRQDLRILLHSAKDVPASSVYALISQIEKMKEDST